MWSGFAYTDGNGDGHGCSIGNAHSYGNCYGNCYSDTNAYCIANAKDYAHTTAASNSASSTVSLRAYTQLSLGTREAIREFPKAIEPSLDRKWLRQASGGRLARRDEGV